MPKSRQMVHAAIHTVVTVVTEHAMKTAKDRNQKILAEFNEDELEVDPHPNEVEVEVVSGPSSGGRRPSPVATVTPHQIHQKFRIQFDPYDKPKNPHSRDNAFYRTCLSDSLVWNNFLEEFRKGDNGVYIGKATHPQCGMGLFSNSQMRKGTAALPVHIWWSEDCVDLHSVLASSPITDVNSRVVRVEYEKAKETCTRWGVMVGPMSYCNDPCNTVKFGTHMLKTKADCNWDTLFEMKSSRYLKKGGEIFYKYAPPMTGSLPEIDNIIPPKQSPVKPRPKQTPVKQIQTPGGPKETPSKRSSSSMGTTGVSPVVKRNRLKKLGAVQEDSE